jgi:hypothetical protein
MPNKMKQEKDASAHAASGNAKAEKKVGKAEKDQLLTEALGESFPARAGSGKVFTGFPAQSSLRRLRKLFRYPALDHPAFKWNH